MRCSDSFMWDCAAQPSNWEHCSQASCRQPANDHNSASENKSSDQLSRPSDAEGCTFPPRGEIRCLLLSSSVVLNLIFFLEPSMSTLGLIEYPNASAEVKAVYDDIMTTRKTDWINNFWKAIAHDPATLK